jgi:hypothetical protein
LNLQVSEQFQLSYFDPQHTEVERRQDSAFGERDTGIKLTIFYVLSARQTTGLISVTDIFSNKTSQVAMKENTLVMMNARAFQFSIS